MKPIAYAEGQTVAFYGRAHATLPITAHHGTILGHLPGQSVGHYRDGFLQDVTIHESPYDARRAVRRLRDEARRRPLPYLWSYHVV